MTRSGKRKSFAPPQARTHSQRHARRSRVGLARDPPGRGQRPPTSGGTFLKVAGEVSGTGKLLKGSKRINNVTVLAGPLLERDIPLVRGRTPHDGKDVHGGWAQDGAGAYAAPP